MSQSGKLIAPGNRSMFRNLCLAVLVWLGLQLPGWSQEKPLKLSIRREWEGARSSAPLSLRVFAKWQRSELLEGRLHLKSFVDTRQISSWTGNEISLSDSELFVWTMSPRPIMTDTTRYALQTELVSDYPGLELEMLDVEVPVRSRRVMVVALIVEHGFSVPAGLGSAEVPNAFERAFTLQDFVTPQDAAHLHLHLSRVDPKDFPDQPLRLTGLDAVMVPHDMLGRLRSTQRETLQRWVAAGGSMLVIRAGQLTESADEWLRDLSLSAWPRTAMRNRGLPDNLSIFDVGLGQLLVLDRGLDGASVEWTRTAGQLLRLRPERTKEITDNRTLSISASNDRRTRDFEKLEPRGRITLQEVAGRTTLQKLLMPVSIRGMPFWLAASVLGLCLVCIGPLDYWVLGVLRKRRWTWVLFPLVALGFTGWMAHLAADHNGRNDARHWLSVVDVTPAGEVLRTTRLELTYGATGRMVPHEVSQQWWCDLRQDDLNSIYDYSSGTSPGPRLEYAGAVPFSYVVSEPVQQWTTRMQRITTLGADPELAAYPLPQVDWKPLLPGLRSAQVPDAELRKQLESFPSQASEAIIGVARPGQAPVWNVKSGSSSHLASLAQEVLPPLLASHDREDGIFYLLSELSPTAGPDCEDLVLTSRHCGLILQEVEAGRYLLTRVIFPTVE